ncbi:peptidoglycan editing factor PgeF [Dehalobacterium formicoaceticum]|uniref:Purine nucleoside phosphorylase n=1 Tax=Dehalobacterium formicoaceticum TaxID=51515 RepID=A0ABT1Y0Z3_9FIRM|nr:peptidoglycan editing factor PgeF [Dehalobacterium formicoaceticum]MCR6544534.1 peptidoglycan editing factor PgeF [Dehalobacterium formicoaceticum]
MKNFVKEPIQDTYIFTIPDFSRSGLVKHGFTCRLGGVSQGDFSSLNLAFHVGDDPDHVIANRKKIVHLLGGKLESLVASEQVHDHQVFVVGASDQGRGSDTYETAIPCTDALITDVPGVMLSSYYADCVPLFFLDPEHQVIALAHAGWRGTVLHMGVITLKKMSETYGTRPEKCLVGIGPSIGSCCFQVDQKVLDVFASSFDFYQQYTKAQGEDKWTIDLPGVNEQLLIQSGVQPEHITKSDLCTSCNIDLFFSHRKEQGRTGRQAALIMLNEESG